MKHPAAVDVWHGVDRREAAEGKVGACFGFVGARYYFRNLSILIPNLEKIESNVPASTRFWSRT
jgi:hypothetical protein